MRYYEYDFALAEPEARERLIALLSMEGFEGFEEEGDGLLAYIPVDQVDETVLDQVLLHFPDLSYVRVELDDVNWNEKWENGFEPVIVEDFAAVRANFHRPVSGVRYELVITPKMSFGTGHHPTTHLMIQEMAHVAMEGKRVLDFGTGTGVLGILANKLGASEVLGIDNDEWSIRNTEENMEQNAATRMRAQLGDIPPSEAEAGRFEVILANITRNVITEHLTALRAIAAPGCIWLFSGFLAEDATYMRELLETAGLTVEVIAQRGDWLVIRAFGQ